MNRIFLFFILTTFWVSCSNTNDLGTDLGNGYTFAADDSQRKLIFPTNSYYETAVYSEVLDYNFNDQHIIAKQSPNREHYKTFTSSDYFIRFAIHSSFLEDSTSGIFYKETTPFIRNSIRADSSLYELLSSKGVTDKNSSSDKAKINVVVDSIFSNDPFYKEVFSSTENYWIIDKPNNLRTGPLTKSEFETECLKENIKLSFKE